MSGVDPRKFEKWIQRNFWRYLRTRKHEVWGLLVKDPETDKTLLFEVYTIPMHNARKNDGMQDYVVKAIAKKMKMSKIELEDHINNGKDLNEKEYIEKLKLEVGNE